MSEKRILALFAMVLGLVAGVLLLVAAVTVRGGQQITLEFLLGRALEVIVGLGILFGSLLMYRGRHSSGGVVNLVLGLVAIVLGYGTLEAALAIISGILGLLAEQTGR